MKREWKVPQLGLLDVSATMARWKGDSWDGFFIGREYADGGDEPGPEAPSGS